MELLIKGNNLLPLLPSDPNYLHAVNDRQCIFVLNVFFCLKIRSFQDFFFAVLKTSKYPSPAPHFFIYSQVCSSSPSMKAGMRFYPSAWGRFFVCPVFGPPYKLLANISLFDLRRYFDIESALLH